MAPVWQDLVIASSSNIADFLSAGTTEPKAYALNRCSSAHPNHLQIFLHVVSISLSKGRCIQVSRVQGLESWAFLWNL